MKRGPYKTKSISENMLPLFEQALTWAQGQHQFCVTNKLYDRDFPMTRLYKRFNATNPRRKKVVVDAISVFFSYTKRGNGEYTNKNGQLIAPRATQWRSRPLVFINQTIFDFAVKLWHENSSWVSETNKVVFKKKDDGEVELTATFKFVGVDAILLEIIQKGIEYGFDMDEPVNLVKEMLK